MDYWPTLPPVAQLPWSYRAWAWWLRHGPRRRSGTLGGNRIFSVLRWLHRGRDEEARYFTLSAPDRPHLVIDLTDFESFHHALAVWYRGDVELDLFRRLTAGSGTFIDIGANYGVYSLGVAYRSRTSVVAVEPQRDVAAAIRRSAVANGLENIHVVETAIGNTVGSAAFQRLPRGSGASSLSRHGSAPGAVHEVVPIVTLDHLCHDLQITGVTCIKIDVEGAETAVIEGAVTLLRRDQPFIIFETSASDPQRPTVLAQLERYGYSELVDVKEVFGRVAEAAVHSPSEIENLVAIPAGKRELFNTLVSSG